MAKIKYNSKEAELFFVLGCFLKKRKSFSLQKGAYFYIEEMNALCVVLNKKLLRKNVKHLYSKVYVFSVSGVPECLHSVQYQPKKESKILGISEHFFDEVEQTLFVKFRTIDSDNDLIFNFQI